MPSLSNLASFLSLIALRPILNGVPVSGAWRRPILKAHDGIRTRDLFLTKEVLYRLSYMGPNFAPSLHVAVRLYGAGNGTRTRDPELGRLALYQLSYSRSHRHHSAFTGGEGRIRTSEGISRQIYSLLPLATREPLRSENLVTGADGRI